MFVTHVILLFFFFNDTATTEIYTLSLHDALPIFDQARGEEAERRGRDPPSLTGDVSFCLRPLVRCRLLPPSSALFRLLDRKSTRLNSSHQIISYAVFCLKKKKMK